MPSTPPFEASPLSLRPALRLGWAVVSVVGLGVMVWAWIAFVPGFVANPEIPYMERVLSPILYTFLMLLMGAGGVLLALAGFRALDRWLRHGSTR